MERGTVDECNNSYENQAGTMRWKLYHAKRSRLRGKEGKKGQKKSAIDEN